MPKPIQPLVIASTPFTRTAEPESGVYLLLDSEFEPDRTTRYELLDDTAAPLRIPHFPVGEIAPWVFGHNADWLRYRLKKRPLTLPNRTELTLRKVRRGHTAEQRLTLPDIERLTWHLAHVGHLSPSDTDRALRILVAVAEQYLHYAP